MNILSAFLAWRERRRAEREVKQRRRVYPRFVADGRMSQDFADKQIATMEAIAADYRAAADAEDSAGRLL